MLVGLECGDSVGAWAALGFDVPVRVGPVEVACDGRGGGLRGWTLVGEGPATVDGIPTAWVGEGGPAGARPLDHVVVVTDSLDRTVDALVAVGGDERRRAELHSPLAFVRLGRSIVEIVERGGPTRLWGLVAVIDDLAALPPALVGTPKDAVQPGRRIVTVRREAGLETAVAFMTPRSPRCGSPGGRRSGPSSAR